MTEIIFNKTSGEFIELKDRYSRIAQANIQDMMVIGELQKIGKRFVFNDFRSGVKKDFDIQKEGIDYGLELFRERLKKELFTQKFNK